MTTTTCENCGHAYHWDWEDAFDKFGFGDGDGQIETWRVQAALECAGYTVEEMSWGCHNTIIRSIKQDGNEQIPEEAKLGYDDPRDFLPRKIISLLDRQFVTEDRGRQPAINRIAREFLSIETLETRNFDALDFHDLAIWSIRDALVAAYQAGIASAAEASATNPPTNGRSS